MIIRDVSLIFEDGILRVFDVTLCKFERESKKYEKLLRRPLSPVIRRLDCSDSIPTGQPRDQKKNICYRKGALEN